MLPAWLITGHNYLSKYLHKIGISITYNNCSLCSQHFKWIWNIWQIVKHLKIIEILESKKEHNLIVNIEHYTYMLG